MIWLELPVLSSAQFLFCSADARSVIRSLIQAVELRFTTRLLRPKTCPKSLSPHRGRGQRGSCCQRMMRGRRLNEHGPGVRRYAGRAPRYMTFRKNHHSRMRSSSCKATPVSILKHGAFLYIHVELVTGELVSFRMRLADSYILRCFQHRRTGSAANRTGMPRSNRRNSRASSK